MTRLPAILAGHGRDRLPARATRSRQHQRVSTIRSAARPILRGERRPPHLADQFHGDLASLWPHGWDQSPSALIGWTASRENLGVHRIQRDALLHAFASQLSFDDGASRSGRENRHVGLDACARRPALDAGPDGVVDVRAVDAREQSPDVGRRDLYHRRFIGLSRLHAESLPRQHPAGHHR